MTLNAPFPIALRTATLAHIPALQELHRRSWVDLGGATYSEAQIAGLMTDIVTAPPDLIVDGTYCVIEHSGRLVASGGWTMREQLDLDGYRPVHPEREAARPRATIRAVFTAPEFARRGLARQIMAHVEKKAVTEGKAFGTKLTATLSGLPFYSRIGYRAGRTITIGPSNGEIVMAVEMFKDTCGRLTPANASTDHSATSAP